MIVTASLTGLIKTLLILIGGFIVLRFFGQLMNAKRNIEEEKELKARKSRVSQEKKRKEKELGKTTILEQSISSDVEDTDYEDV